MIRRAFELIFTRRDFGLLMGVQFAAQAGDGIVQAALGKLIVFGGEKGFDLEGARSPDDILGIVLLTFIPYTLVSPFLGVVIDRWERRRLLFVANALRSVAIVGVGVWSAVGQIPNGVLIAALLLTLSSTRVVLATKAAALPATLDGRALVEGNATSQLGGALFQLGGAGTALIAADVIAVEPIVFAGAIVYAIGAFFAIAIHRAGEVRPPSTFVQEIGRVIRNIVAGVQEVARTPKAGASITTYFWLRLLWSFTLAGVGLIARELIGDDDLQIAVVIGGAGAIGAVLGFVLAQRLHERVKTTAQLVLSASTIGGAAVLALGAVEREVALAALTFFLGFGFFLAKISLDTMVQEALGDDFRGRAFSLYDIAYNLAWVLAAAVMKIWWSQDVQGVLIAGMGAVFLLGVGAIGAWFKRAGLLAPLRAQAPADA
ncbi:MAG: MFS transporter [Actinomycetota bacterium]